jgi:HK97 family phage prohead protease
MEIKTIQYKVSDISQKTKEVKAYFSVFGNVDLTGDIVEPGAFTKTINERGPNGNNLIKHLINHDPHQQPPGVLKELGEDSKGGFFVSKLIDTRQGQDLYIMYREGIIDQHSMGYDVIKAVNESDGNHIKEVRLWEVSSLYGWAMNPEARTIDVKSADDVIQLIKKTEHILRQGDLSDEVLSHAERLYKTLRAAIPALSEPSSEFKEILTNFNF